MSYLLLVGILIQYGMPRSRPSMIPQNWNAQLVGLSNVNRTKFLISVLLPFSALLYWLALTIGYRDLLVLIPDIGRTVLDRHILIGLRDSLFHTVALDCEPSRKGVSDVIGVHLSPSSPGLATGPGVYRRGGGPAVAHLSITGR